MDLDLLSLPPEILAKIFSNIPWDKLINIKLTSRKFNYVTDKYLKDMQKPKLHKIIFENDGTDRSRVAYTIIKTGMNLSLDDVSDEKEFFFSSSKPGQLHSFLQKVDLTSLNIVDIVLANDTRVIGIFSDYFCNTNIMEHVGVAVNGSEENIGDTLSFLQKVQNVKSLGLQFFFGYQSILRDLIVPVRNSLEVLDIFENEQTLFVNSRMMGYIIENNPDLYKYNLSLSSFETYKMVIEKIVNEEMSRRNSGCFHKSIYLQLVLFCEDTLSELLSYFYSEEFPYNETTMRDERIFYYGKLECPVCGEIDSIEIS
uniref:F-box domain-containing protein n=1 Tax=Strongyloides papillosus TaxID=174720 RepID=A0A0N5BYS2_STREA